MSFGAVAAIGGAVIAADAAGSAADKQAGAAQSANATSRAAYDQQTRMLDPFYSTGSAANNRLAQLLGIQPDADPRQVDTIYNQLLNEANADHARQFGYDYASAPAWAQNEIANRKEELMRQAKQMAKSSPQAQDQSADYGSLLKQFTGENLESDPGYKFRQAEGQKGVERSAASRGGLFSGAAGKALTRFNQDYSANEFQNAYNRDATDKNRIYSMLSGTSGAGQNAAVQTGVAGQNYANNYANNTIGAANAEGAAGIAQANAIGGGVNDAFNYYNQTNALNKALQSGSAYGNLKNQYFTGTGGMGD